MKSKAIFIVLLVVLLIIFVLQNTEVVKVNLFFWDLNIPAALLLFVCFAVGLILGLIIPSSRSKKVSDSDE